MSHESTFCCLHWVVRKLNPLQPNQKNHNLTPLLQDDSALIQQLWEQQPKTLEHLFHDLVGFSESSIFSTNRRKRGFSGIANLLKDLDITLIYTSNYLEHFLLGKLCFGIKQGRSILFKTLPYRHRDLWCPYQLLKYSPLNDTKPPRAHIQANNLFTPIHNISP